MILPAHLSPKEYKMYRREFTQDRTCAGRGKSGKEKKARMALGAAILENILMRPEFKGGPLSRDVIAVAYGCTPEGIARLEHVAIAKARGYMVRHGMMSDLWDQMYDYREPALPIQRRFRR